MKKLLIVVILAVSALPAMAQDLCYQDVESVFSIRDLPKSKNIRSYQAFDKNIYNIGDTVVIGTPKDGAKNFAYIMGANPLKYSAQTAKIQGFVILPLKDKETGNSSCLLACNLIIEKKRILVMNLDRAIQYGEIIGK